MTASATGTVPTAAVDDSLLALVIPLLATFILLFPLSDYREPVVHGLQKLKPAGGPTGRPRLTTVVFAVNWAQPGSAAMGLVPPFR